MVLADKKILLGITGSIAACKAPALVRLLVKAGAEVQVVMTPAAASFVTPLTLSTLSKRPVLMELFAEGAWTNHVALGRWADLMMIAPLSCNTLSKMAAGACDNLLMATYLSATCPVAAAPAMDEDMWHHAATRRNLEALRGAGVSLLPVGRGELASGLYGDGRMAEPEEILSWISRFLQGARSLEGKRALVTAGPTYEAIDPVRFIGNHSSGKMGFALAAELAQRGAEVTLVSGPVSLAAPAGVRLVSVVSAAQMMEACLKEADRYDLAVMAAAVADYAPATAAPQKLKKSDAELQIDLRRTGDILATLGGRKGVGQVLAGFALETEAELDHARKKLTGKNADLIVLNSLRDEGAGFGVDTNRVTLLYRDGREERSPLLPKREIAGLIADALTNLIR